MTEPTADLGLIIAREAARERDPRRNRPHPNRRAEPPVDLSDIYEKLAKLNARRDDRHVSTPFRSTTVTQRHPLTVTVPTEPAPGGWRVDAEQVRLAGEGFTPKILGHIEVCYFDRGQGRWCGGTSQYVDDETQRINLNADAAAVNANNTVWHELTHCWQRSCLGNAYNSAYLQAPDAFEAEARATADKYAPQVQLVIDTRPQP